MVPNTTDREHLASDLELLGLLADPGRGPLAHLLSPTQPPLKTTTLPAIVTDTWHRGRAAALAIVQRARAVRPTGQRRLPTRAVQTR